jgi:hypothetical protein
MGKRRREIVPRRLFSFAEVIGDRHMINVSVGPQLAPVILSLERAPDYRIESPGWASFPKKRADRPNRFRIHHRVADEVWCAIDLPDTPENYHAVQPLGRDECLLVRGRADGEEDRNAHVYDASGRHVRSFHAGDGIQDVQATADGKIWVGYFDEGVFGNTKLGSAGLVCLDDRGRCSFRFTDVLGEGVPEICDCYALNVASGREVWLCYYTDFPLVRLINGKLDGVWPRLPVRGSSGFAVDGETALSGGGYDDKDSLHLVRLGEKKTLKMIPTDEVGRPLKKFSAFGRRDRLYLQTLEALHAVDLADTAT